MTDPCTIAMRFAVGVATGLACALAVDLVFLEPESPAVADLVGALLVLMLLALLAAGAFSLVLMTTGTTPTPRYALVRGLFCAMLTLVATGILFTLIGGHALSPFMFGPVLLVFAVISGLGAKFERHGKNTN